MALWRPYLEETALDLSASNQISPSPSYFPNVPSPSESFENDSLSEDEEYQEFERESFRAMAAKNGGCILKNNSRMRRVVQTAVETDDYKAKRNKNNIAAKQSRDRRKLREARLAVQVAFLKKKVAELKAKLNKGACAQCFN